VIPDARFLARAGIQTYRFLPLRLPETFEPLPLIHGADERVPADALGLGVEAIVQAIERYSG
jgi:acetylornithine deacetylase/succinyl-diaminopimelate desuccinylase-like protein